MTTPSPRAIQYLTDTLGDHYEAVLALADKMTDAGGASDVLGHHDAAEYDAVHAEFINKAPVPVNDATNARRTTIEALWAKSGGVPGLADLFGTNTNPAEALAKVFGGDGLAGLLSGDPAATKKREAEVADAARNAQARSFAAFVLAMPADMAPPLVVDELYDKAGLAR